MLHQVAIRFQSWKQTANVSFDNYGSMTEGSGDFEFMTSEDDQPGPNRPPLTGDVRYYGVPTGSLYENRDMLRWGILGLQESKKNIEKEIEAMERRLNKTKLTKKLKPPKTSSAPI